MLNRTTGKKKDRRVVRIGNMVDHQDGHHDFQDGHEDG